MEIHLLFAKISWLLLIVILSMRPFGEILENKKVLSLLKYRKHLGIICGVSALLHVFIFLAGMGLLGKYFTNSAFWSWKTLFGWGSFALVAMMFPLVTSNIASQKYFKKNWKNIQRISYPTFILVTIHVALVKEEGVIVFVPVFLWTVLWIWAYLKKQKVLKK